MHRDKHILYSVRATCGFAHQCGVGRGRTSRCSSKLRSRVALISTSCREMESCRTCLCSTPAPSLPSGGCWGLAARPLAPSSSVNAGGACSSMWQADERLNLWQWSWAASALRCTPCTRCATVQTAGSTLRAGAEGARTYRMRHPHSLAAGRQQTGAAWHSSTVEPRRLNAIALIRKACPKPQHQSLAGANPCAAPWPCSPWTR